MWQQPLTHCDKYVLKENLYINLSSEDELYSFGNNSFGQLGFGDPTQHDVVPNPTLVHMLSDKRVSKLAAGACFSMVLSGTLPPTPFSHQVIDEGEVFSFGDNSTGQLGLGTKKAHYYPQLVSSLKDKPIKHIAAGVSFAAAITGKPHENFDYLLLPDKGQLWMWGNNAHGQLGLGHTNKMSVPTQVTFFSKNKAVEKIACGTSHTMVVSRMSFSNDSF